MPSLQTSGVRRAAPTEPSVAPAAAKRSERRSAAALRVFEQRDIATVVDLFDRVYPEHRWTAKGECEAYCREILIESPWTGLAIPSWVALDGERAIGFAGIVPRPMVFRGRELRVAVGAQFMVDPEQRFSLTGLQLAKAVLSGPQDLFIADGSNGQARRMWQGIGGSVPLAHNLHWTRPLRPARQIVSAVGEIQGYRALEVVARPIAAVIDAVAARLRPNQFQHRGDGLTESDLDAATMLPHLAQAMRGNHLQPVYDTDTLAWLLAQLARKKRHGVLRMKMLHDAKGDWAGWYLYYLAPKGLCEVIQIAARDAMFDIVLRRLLIDAWKGGAVAVRGRLDPRHLETLSDRHCWLRREDPATLVHTRDPELLAAFHSGEAFISRLEGEWWMRFVGG
jgi:hypothetical protein